MTKEIERVKRKIGSVKLEGRVTQKKTRRKRLDIRFWVAQNSFPFFRDGNSPLHLSLC